jgi:alkaline phosphatase
LSFVKEQGLLMNKFCALAYSVLASALLISCANQPDQTNTASGGQLKNIILMIGDGMGPQQVGLLQDFATYSKTPIYQNRDTAIEVFANSGQIALSSTRPFNKLVVDSACSATQLATGQPALSEVIGLDAEGNAIQTVLERAKLLGKATGLITDTRVTHATPAAFAAHQTHRSMENAIAVDMLQNNVDVLLGGGLRHWIPQGSSSAQAPLAALINEPSLSIKSKRRDTRNLLTEARNADYQLAFSAQQLQAIRSGKVLGLFSSSAMNNGIAYSNCKAADNCIQPSLGEMTKKALNLLSRDDDGFFLMIEGGQIDWAGHNNDAGDLLHEMLKFDEAVQAVYDWVKNRNDTLVVITADHETGGFGFSYSRRNVPLADSSISGDAFAASQRSYKPNFNFVGHEILDQLYAQKKDFYNIWYEAGGNLSDIEPKPDALQRAVNNNTAFTISLGEAQRILEHEPNHYQTDGHRYLAAAEFPKVDDFGEFYVYSEEVHLNLIGRALAKYQNTVWSTGTHTHTPVAVIAWGPYPMQQQFHGLMNHVEVGALLMQSLGE